MIKNPFSISEVNAMWDDNDEKSLIAFFLIVTTPILDFVSIYLYFIKSEYYAHWEWFIPTLIFLLSCAFIYLYRPWFSSNVTKIVDEHFSNMLQKYDDTKETIDKFKNIYLDNLKLNPKIRKSIEERIEKHFDTLNKRYKDQVEIQANLKKINEFDAY